MSAGTLNDFKWPALIHLLLSLFVLIIMITFSFSGLTF